MKNLMQLYREWCAFMMLGKNDYAIKIVDCVLSIVENSFGVKESDYDKGKYLCDPAGKDSIYYWSWISSRIPEGILPSVLIEGQNTGRALSCPSSTLIDGRINYRGLKTTPLDELNVLFDFDINDLAYAVLKDEKLPDSCISAHQLLPFGKILLSMNEVQMNLMKEKGYRITPRERGAAIKNAKAAVMIDGPIRTGKFYFAPKYVFDSSYFNFDRAEDFTKAFESDMAMGFSMSEHQNMLYCVYKDFLLVNRGVEM